MKQWKQRLTEDTHLHIQVQWSQRLCELDTDRQMNRQCWYKLNHLYTARGTYDIHRRLSTRQHINHTHWPTHAQKWLQQHRYMFNRDTARPTN